METLEEIKKKTPILMKPEDAFQLQKLKQSVDREKVPCSFSFSYSNQTGTLQRESMEDLIGSLYSDT